MAQRRYVRIPLHFSLPKFLLFMYALGRAFDGAGRSLFHGACFPKRWRNHIRYPGLALEAYDYVYSADFN